MASNDGEYCFSYFTRFIDKFTDFKQMSLGNFVIICYSMMWGMYWLKFCVVWLQKITKKKDRWMEKVSHVFLNLG